jgi:transcriptional regulator with XRE-family HTH domain
MNGQIDNSAQLTAKIARLVQERGWNQEDFVRQTGLNRQTVREILQARPDRRLRNDTVCRCARVLGLSVNDLHSLPLERLLARLHSPALNGGDSASRQLYDQATQPELQAWLERNPDRARQLQPEEMDELLSLQGTGGPLTRIGVEHFVGLIERKRQLVHKVHAIAGTEYLDLLEQFVDLVYEKVQPYADRV